MIHAISKIMILNCLNMMTFRERDLLSGPASKGKSTADSQIYFFSDLLTVLRAGAGAAKCCIDLSELPNFVLPIKFFSVEDKE
jgi:hypothetical protein